MIVFLFALVYDQYALIELLWQVEVYRKVFDLGLLFDFNELPINLEVYIYVADGRSVEYDDNYSEASCSHTKYILLL